MRVKGACGAMKLNTSTRSASYHGPRRPHHPDGRFHPAPSSFVPYNRLVPPLRDGATRTLVHAFWKWE